jgi:topoisomerase-4 subunit B
VDQGGQEHHAVGDALGLVGEMLTHECVMKPELVSEDDGFVHSYCNTIPTPDGGTHEAGLRMALLRALKEHAERIGQAKKASSVTTDDVMSGCAAMISVFIREPEFQGQNKGRLMSAGASRIVDQTVRDAFDPRKTFS